MDGAALADVLRAAGVETDPSLQVAFDACDEVEMPNVGRFTYGASIPITKAMSPEVLLAYSMNDETLAPEHGFPIRVVVPGFAGVRSPKWLTTITVQDRPSDNHMQQRDYKLMPPDVTAETVDWEEGITIYEMPLNSAICEPASRAEIRASNVTLRGYAVSTARQIMRVDVSSDGGRTWKQAELMHDANAHWSWTFWSARLDLAKGERELAVRARDLPGRPSRRFRTTSGTLRAT
jgi:sulfite oxidase